MTHTSQRSRQATIPAAVRRNFTTTATAVTPVWEGRDGEPMLDADGNTIPRIDHPTIEQVFYPRRGWVRQDLTKRVTPSWLRKLRAGGATAVALRCGARRADFAIRAALAG
jgi:hypothetical protein